MVKRDENVVNYNIIHIWHSTKSIEHNSFSINKNPGNLIFLQIFCLNIVLRVCRRQNTIISGYPITNIWIKPSVAVSFVGKHKYIYIFI